MTNYADKYMIILPRDEIDKKTAKKIRQLLDQGKNDDAMKLIVLSTFDKNCDTATIMAAMEAAKMLQMKPEDLLSKSLQQIIPQTMLRYVVNESINRAESKIEKPLTEKQRYLLERSLMRSIATWTK